MQNFVKIRFYSGVNFFLDTVYIIYCLKIKKKSPYHINEPQSNKYAYVQY